MVVKQIFNQLPKLNGLHILIPTSISWSATKVIYKFNLDKNDIPKKQYVKFQITIDFIRFDCLK